MTTAQASVGQASNSVDALEAAMVAGTAAGELFALSGTLLHLRVSSVSRSALAWAACLFAGVLAVLCPAG
jgi:hypothetical protein